MAIMSDSETIQIVTAAPEGLVEVLSLLFGDHKPQDASNRMHAALAEFRAGKLPREGLFVAQRNGRTVGATFTHVLPGRSATFWPPRLVAEEPEETAEQLTARAVAYARSAGTGVIHALLEGQPAPEDITRLESAGFTSLAELYYLLAESHDFPAAPPESPLIFEPCTPEKHQRLCAVVNATYEATLDCPGLDEVRTAADVLEGYGAGAGACPPHWYIIRHNESDVGCLLMADYPEHGNCELTYMGLVPSARGSGWGLVVTRQAQWIARSLGRPRLVLAVDSANQPARDVYVTAGFRGWDRRHVYMLILES